MKRSPSAEESVKLLFWMTSVSEGKDTVKRRRENEGEIQNGRKD